MRILTGAAIIAAAALTFAAPAMAVEGDATKGEAVFKKCGTCHEIGKNKIGPNLAGVIGRQPGTLADYKYSKAMIDFGQGKVWDEALLTTYLHNPKEVVKGTKMAFVGLKSDEDIANVIAYIKSAAPAAQ
jgi:cytochrome c